MSEALAFCVSVWANTFCATHSSLPKARFRRMAFAFETNAKRYCAAVESEKWNAADKLRTKLVCLATGRSA